MGHQKDMFFFSAFRSGSHVEILSGYRFHCPFLVQCLLKPWLSVCFGVTLLDYPQPYHVIIAFRCSVKFTFPSAHKEQLEYRNSEEQLGTGSTALVVLWLSLRATS